MHTDIHSKVLVRIKMLYTTMSEVLIQGGLFREIFSQGGRRWFGFFNIQLGVDVHTCFSWLNLTTLVNLISLSDKHEKTHMRHVPPSNCATTYLYRRGR